MSYNARTPMRGHPAMKMVVIMGWSPPPLTPPPLATWCYPLSAYLFFVCLVRFVDATLHHAGDKIGVALAFAGGLHGLPHARVESSQFR